MSRVSNHGKNDIREREVREVGEGRRREWLWRRGEREPWRRQCNKGTRQGKEDRDVHSYPKPARLHCPALVRGDACLARNVNRQVRSGSVQDRTGNGLHYQTRRRPIYAHLDRKPNLRSILSPNPNRRCSLSLALTLSHESRTHAASSRSHPLSRVTDLSCLMLLLTRSHPLSRRLQLTAHAASCLLYACSSVLTRSHPLSQSHAHGLTQLIT